MKSLLLRSVVFGLCLIGTSSAFAAMKSCSEYSVTTVSSNGYCPAGYEGCERTHSGGNNCGQKLSTGGSGGTQPRVQKATAVDQNIQTPVQKK